MSRVGSGLAPLVSFLEWGKPTPYASIASALDKRNEVCLAPYAFIASALDKRPAPYASFDPAFLQ